MPKLTSALFCFCEKSGDMEKAMKKLDEWEKMVARTKTALVKQ